MLFIPGWTKIGSSLKCHQQLRCVDSLTPRVSFKICKSVYIVVAFFEPIQAPGGNLPTEPGTDHTFLTGPQQTSKIVNNQNCKNVQNQQPPQQFLPTILQQSKQPLKPIVYNSFGKQNNVAKKYKLNNTKSDQNTSNLKLYCLHFVYIQNLQKVGLFICKNVDFWVPRCTNVTVVPELERVRGSPSASVLVRVGAIETARTVRWVQSRACLSSLSRRFCRTRLHISF